MGPRTSLEAENLVPSGIRSQTLLCASPSYFSHISWLPSGSYKMVGIKVKVKCSRYRPGVAQRVGRGTAVLFLDHGTRRG